jgi:hypothetical protein
MALIDASRRAETGRIGPLAGPEGVERRRHRGGRVDRPGRWRARHGERRRPGVMGRGVMGGVRRMRQRAARGCRSH